MLWFGLKLLGMGKWLADAARGIARWMLLHPWQAACIARLCLSAWTWHGKSAANDRADRIEAQAKADNALWAKAHATSLGSLKRVTGALNGWSAYTRQWSATSIRQQKASQARFKDATTRRDVSEAVALRIERGAPVKGCQTSPEVLAAKGEL